MAGYASIERRIKALEGQAAAKRVLRRAHIVEIPWDAPDDCDISPAFEDRGVRLGPNDTIVRLKFGSDDRPRLVTSFDITDRGRWGNGHTYETDEEKRRRIDALNAELGLRISAAGDLIKDDHQRSETAAADPIALPPIEPPNVASLAKPQHRRRRHDPTPAAPRQIEPFLTVHHHPSQSQPHDYDAFDR